jgi:hypothetical protein
MSPVSKGKKIKKRSRSMPMSERRAANAVKTNKGNHLINIMQPGVIAELLADYIPPQDMQEVGKASSALNDSTRDIYGEGIKRDLEFKKLWEKKKLHEFFYTVPCWLEGKGQVIYKINKKEIDVASYQAGLRRPSGNGRGPPQNYGCLNNITYYGKPFTIYDFVYTVPTVDSPIELDQKWKQKIKDQYVSEGFVNWEAEQKHLVEEKYAELTQFLQEGERVPPAYNRFAEDTTGRKLLDENNIAQMMEKDRFNWCYIDEQMAWFNDVFLLFERDIVELTSLLNDAKNALIGLVSSCGIQGGKRKRTRRRRKKNRKKRTKKKARRKRRRKSSKRRRRRKR